jgi:VanZ family protein
MAGIFALSSLSAETIERTAEPVQTALPLMKLIKDSAVHVVEFGVLAVLAYRVLAAYGTLAGPYLWLTVLAGATGYAATDELHQSFVPGRVSSWQDLGYDFLGGLIGLLVAEIGLLVRRRH